MVAVFLRKMAPPCHRQQAASMRRPRPAMPSAPHQGMVPYPLMQPSSGRRRGQCTPSARMHARSRSSEATTAGCGSEGCADEQALRQSLTHCCRSPPEGTGHTVRQTCTRSVGMRERLGGHCSACHLPTDCGHRMIRAARTWQHRGHTHTVKRQSILQGTHGIAGGSLGRMHARVSSGHASHSGRHLQAGSSRRRRAIKRQTDKQS